MHAIEEESGIIRGLGCIPQELDDRDHKFRLDYAMSSVSSPADYDPTKIFRSIEGQADTWEKIPTYDQLSVGSCTAQTLIGDAHHWHVSQNYKWQFTGSRMFQYYNSRKLDGTVDEDAGATIRGAVKALAKFGVCPEDHPQDNWNWPYLDDGKTFKKEPPKQCYENAVVHTALEYKSVPQDEETVKHLLSRDIPICFGFAVKSSFMSKETAKTGVMKKPSWIEQTVGGHAVLAVGYLSKYSAGSQGIKDWIIVRNSWGTGWGKNGYFLMPLEVFLNPAHSSDFWIITKFGHPRAS